MNYFYFPENMLVPFEKMYFCFFFFFFFLLTRNFEHFGELGDRNFFTDSK